MHAFLVEGGQESHAADAVGGVAAGDIQGAALLGADGQQDGVVVLLQLLEADVTADAGVHLHLDTHVENALVLAVHDVARHAVAGDAVAGHTAQFGPLVENRRAMAESTQLIGRRHAGDATTDDRDPLAGFLRGSLEGQSLLQGMVADELFNGVDADEVLDLVAVAAFLAGCRADPAHHRREGIGVGGATEGIFLPGNTGRRLFDAAHDLQPATDVLARGTAALAGRGLVHVGGTLVGGVLVEDIVRPARVIVFAIAVTAECQFVFHCSVTVSGGGFDNGVTFYFQSSPV